MFGGGGVNMHEEQNYINKKHIKKQKKLQNQGGVVFPLGVFTPHEGGGGVKISLFQDYILIR